MAETCLRESFVIGAVWREFFSYLSDVGVIKFFVMQKPDSSTSIFEKKYKICHEYISQNYKTSCLVTISPMSRLVALVAERTHSQLDLISKGSLTKYGDSASFHKPQGWKQKLQIYSHPPSTPNLSFLNPLPTLTLQLYLPASLPHHPTLYLYELSAWHHFIATNQQCRYFFQYSTNIGSIEY